MKLKPVRVSENRRLFFKNPCNKDYHMLGLY